MKTILLIILVFSALISSLFPRTHIICREGTGDFTTITAGIDAALDGDTLLVYPGRYVENINYDGKNIVITSLYGIEDDNRDFIRNTIIDGNESGSVVTFRNDENQEAVINGFTITNGFAVFGGGIRVRHSSPTISNCIIKNNAVNRSGGGIDLSRSFSRISNCLIEYNFSGSGGGGITLQRNPWQNGEGRVFLEGNTVRYNHTLGVNGGIRGSGADFCSDNLNSIYFNYAGTAVNDLVLGDIEQQYVIVDTFTVVNPDPEERYFLGINIETTPEDLEFTVLNSKIEPVAADLYVAADGCDTNSGLTAADPLQTIAFAMSKIEPGSIEPDIPEERRNIYVADGIYSKSLNNQYFPVQNRPGINVIGQSKENTILDMEHRGRAFVAGFNNRQTSGNLTNFSIKNFSIINGGCPDDIAISSTAGIRLYRVYDYELENIGIYNGVSRRKPGTAIYSNADSNFRLRNIEVKGCRGKVGVSLGLGHAYYGEPRFEELFGYVENLRIKNFSYREGEDFLDERGQSMIVGAGSHLELPFDLTIVNLEITDGHIGNTDPFWNYNHNHLLFTSPVRVISHRGLRLINATIGNNIFPGGRKGGGIAFSGRWDSAEIINSIIYGNTPDNVYLYSEAWWETPMNISFSHSLLEGGIDDIYFDVDTCPDNVSWGEGNIDADPMWVGEEVSPDYPYMLSENSPARGAGTLDIPDFEFPEYDLAGNPRIVDGQIDMGAYQWHPIDEGRERVRRRETAEERHEEYNLRNFPNPAVSLGSVDATRSGVSSGERTSTGTTISFEAPEAGNVVIEIYNLKGQFVSRVFDADVSPGEYNVYWDGRDERNRPVATGFYMYHLKFNDQLVATGRCTFIK